MQHGAANGMACWQMTLCRALRRTFRACTGACLTIQQVSLPAHVRQRNLPVTVSYCIQACVLSNPCCIAAAGSDKDKAKEKADAKKPEEDIWKGLDQAANMGVDEYALFCQQQLTAKPPPPIKTPERDWRSMQVKPDSDRIYYQRTTQHARIAQSMNDAQKATVKADVSAALKNRELLRAVAAQSGFIVPEVADCLRTLDNVRKSNQRLLAWQASGRPMPKGREEIARVMAKVRREEGDADWRRLRAACDPQNCPVVRKQGVLTPAVVCTLTRLPYYRCCGAAARRAAPKALPAAAASAAAPAPAPAS